MAPGNLSLAWAIPDYPVGSQLRWLLNAATAPPVPAPVLRAHFDTQFLVVPPAGLNQDLRGPSPTGANTGDLPRRWFDNVRARGQSASGNERFGSWPASTGTLIDGLRVSPAPALPSAPTSWADLDAQLRSLATDVSFEAATLALLPHRCGEHLPGLNSGAGHRPPARLDVQAVRVGDRGR